MVTKAQLWLVKLMVLLHHLPLAEGVALAKHLRLRRAEMQATLHVLTTWRMALDTVRSSRATAADVVRMLAEWSEEGLLLLYLLGGGERVSRYWHRWRRVKLAITGAEVQRLGVPAGPRVGRILARVLSDCLDGGAPDHRAQLALARRYASEEE